MKKMNASVTPQKYTLDNLTATTAQVKNAQFTGPHGEKVVVEKKKFNGLAWLIISALVVGLLLFIFRPSLVLSTNQVTGEQTLDWGKLILWSLVFALGITLIVWLITGAGSMNVFETKVQA